MDGIRKARPPYCHLSQVREYHPTPDLPQFLPHNADDDKISWNFKVSRKDCQAEDDLLSYQKGSRVQHVQNRNARFGRRFVAFFSGEKLF